MKNIGKKIAALALSVLLFQNTAFAACNCGSKPRHELYKPYQNGKYSYYYGALSRYYTQSAAKASSLGHKDVAAELFNKANRAQNGRVRIETPARSASDYNELSNARKLLRKNSTHQNMGLFPRQLAAAQYYYDAWVIADKAGLPTLEKRTNFYKYINIVINGLGDDAQPLSLDKSKHLERYLTKQNLLGTMYFPFDNHTKILNTDKRSIVEDARMSVGKDHILVIVGNTDTVGKQMYNIDLSVDRAKTVRALLIAHGVQSESIEIVAFGKNRVSVDFGSSTYDNSANRRVEIYAIKKDSACGQCN